LPVPEVLADSAHGRIVWSAAIVPVIATGEELRKELLALVAPGQLEHVDVRLTAYATARRGAFVHLSCEMIEIFGGKDGGRTTVRAARWIRRAALALEGDPKPPVEPYLAQFAWKAPDRTGMQQPIRRIQGRDPRHAI